VSGLPHSAGERGQRILARRHLTRLARRPETAANVCVIYGNCQAEPLRRLLASAPEFPYGTISLPAVHQMSAADAESLRRILPYVAVLVTQPVRDGYRDLALGSDEMSALVSGRVIRVVQLYYQGLFPFQAYVRSERYSAPRTEYDDLRFLYCAARGYSAERASGWLSEYEPPLDAVRELAAASYAELERREREHSVDVRCASRMVDRDVHAHGFFTINHPALTLLNHLAAGVADQLGVRYEPQISSELLGRVRTPLEPAVCTALKLDATAARDWWLKGRRMPRERLLGIHLRAYAARPEVLRAGVEQHADRMAFLGLAV
jgi:hypothetical protein